MSKLGKVYCKVCKKEATHIFISPSGKEQAGYCDEHYGDWIFEQNLFPNWKEIS